MTNRAVRRAMTVDAPAPTGPSRVLAALVVLLLLVLAACSAGPRTDPYADLLGSWAGRIEVPDRPLDIGIRFTDAGGLGGTIDIPVQGIVESPLGEVRLADGIVSFTVPEVPGNASFRGRLDGSGPAATIRGEFRQGGQTLRMSLTRGTVAPLPRPQEPRPPFPYRSEQARYRSGDVELAGTLTVPEGDGPFTAVLLLTGSGPQDRDETIFEHKPFLLLADTLTRAGYAVLRTDDRGVGGSGGNLATAGYDGLTDDALAGVEYLKGRPDVDPARIGLLGHSEGGYIAPLAAQRSGAVAFVIMMAGPAVSGEEVLALQNRLLFEVAGAPPDQVDAQVAYVHEMAGLLRAEDYPAAETLTRRRIEQQSATLPEDRRPGPQEIEAQARAATTPTRRSFVTYDPGPALDALTVPVLACYGSKDLQVPATQNDPALRDRFADHPDATVRTFPGLNHLMQPAKTGSLDEYAQTETTISPEVLDLITDWLRARY
ncbi:MAG: alpha/beta hydrolase family protein [Pseudonocardiaceae bacterium]